MPKQSSSVADDADPGLLPDGASSGDVQPTTAPSPLLEPPPEQGAGLTPTAGDDALADAFDPLTCPSGRPDDPFGPTSEAPFGYYKAGEKQGLPKPNAAGRPPNRGPRDERPASTERVATVARKAGPRKPAQAPTSQQTLVSVDYEMLGQAAAGTWINVGIMAFGDDWAPNIEKREHVALKDCFKQYFEAKKISDFPPGIALSIALVTYSLARIDKPTVRGRFASMFVAVGRGYSWLKGRFARKMIGA